MVNEYLHYLHDTIILLGGKREIADLLNDPNNIKESDIDDLRNINCQLIDSAKDKLVNINKMKVVVGCE